MKYRLVGRAVVTVLMLGVLMVSGCGGGGGGGDNSGVNQGGGSSSDGATQNQPPTADAGEDVVVNEETTIQLSAGQSDDLDGTIEGFHWEQLSGPAVQVESWDVASISFTAPVTEDRVTLEFQVTVTDDDGASASDQATVTVVPYAPLTSLEVYFPNIGTRFFGKSVSVVGSIDKGRAAISGVEIKATAGAGEVAAVIQGDGIFTISSLQLPENNQNPVIRIDAYQNGVVEKSAQIDFENKPTLVRPLIDIDNANPESIFVLDSSNLSNDRLFRLDLKTGVFQDLLGAETRLPWQSKKITHDLDNNRVLISSYPPSFLRSIELDAYRSEVMSGESVGGGPLPASVADIALDPVGNQVLVIDDSQDALYSINLSTGDRKIISENDSVGSGVAFSNPNRVTVDSENRVAYVYSNASLIAVDLNSGDRSVTTSNSVGSGPTISDPYTMAFDPIRRAVVLSLPWTDIYRVFVDSGDSENFSPTGQSGIIGGYWSDVLYDHHFDRYLGKDIGGWYSSSDSIFTVDSSTGERLKLFEQHVGSGPEVGELRDVVIAGEDSGYLLDYGAGSLQKIDLLTGTRSEISGATKGSGPAIEYPQKMTVDSVAGVAYVLQRWDSLNSPTQVLKIDMVSGDRVIIASESVGSGPAITASRGIALNPESGLLYFADADAGAVIALNVSDMSREIVSSPDIGTGEGFIEPAGIAFDPVSKRIFVSDRGLGGTDSARVFAIDPETGNRTTIYEPYIDPLPNLGDVGDIDIMPDGNRILIRSNHDQIALLDVDGHAREIFSSNDIGKGEFLMNVTSVAVSPNGVVAYFTSYNYQALFAVNLATGDRVIVAK